MSTRGNARGPKSTIPIWLKKLEATRVSIETVKVGEKRIPGGIYHRFVEERARQLGGSVKRVGRIYRLHNFLYFPRLLRGASHESSLTQPTTWWK